MEQYFASLSKRQTMLLLTAVTFGGANSVEAFDHLPDEECDLLKHRAHELLQIPRDKRIPFLVQEIKRLVTARRRQLASVDPARLASVLGKERSALVEVVLRALPSLLADSVRKLAPGQPVKLQREVRPDVLSIIRWKLEEAIRQSAPKGASLFKFTDLITLQSRELLTIADRMGARALATAIAGLPDADRDAFFVALPPDQRSLAQRASDAGKSRKLTDEDSRTVLEMHNALKEPSTGMRSAGAQRLARAALAQAPEFAARLIERNTGDFGRLLVRWTREERNKPVRGDGGRTDIVEQMERLAQRGVIDRPMRLPPPQSKPPPTAGQLAQRAADRRAGVLGPPPEKRVLNPERSRSAAAVPVAAPGKRSDGERRDFIAQREARKAGAVSSHSAPPPKRPSGTASLRPQRPVTDPNIKAAKIMRDGKELRRQDQAKGQPVRASSAVQEAPKRKSPQQPAGTRSPILRNTAPTNASGRGPGRGSR